MRQLTITLAALLVFACASKESKIEEKPLSHTDKLISDLKAKYGEFHEFSDDTTQNRIYVEYRFKGGFDKPDLIHREINKSLNMLPTKSNEKTSVSFSGDEIELSQYTWQTPQFKVDMNNSSSFDQSGRQTAKIDSVF